MPIRMTAMRTTGLAVALTVVALSSSAAQQTARRTTSTTKVRCTTARDSTMRDSTNCVRTKSLASTRSTRSTRSTTRIPVAKERTGTAGGQVDTTVVAPRPPVETTTVVVTQVPTPPPPPVETTTVVTPVETTTVAPAPVVVRHYGNGFYIGIGGGASVPMGGTNDAYKMGYNVTVPFGWDAPLGALGIRADVSYDQFGARSSFRTAAAGTAVALTSVNPQVWSGNADLKFRLPFVGRFTGGATTGLYAIGGIGTSYFRNYNTTFAVTNPNTNSTTTTVYGDTVAVVPASNYSSIWRFDANVGGGLSIGLGSTELFVESRYVRVFTSPQRLNWVPVIVGLTFR